MSSGRWRRKPLPPPRIWGPIRRRVLERDGYRCRIRGPRCTGLATEVDHIGDDDDHSDENLRSACMTCHRSRTGRQGQAARPRLKRPHGPHPGLV